jgi:pimeloyl-ACP methyl ester carboxylesterase
VTPGSKRTDRATRVMLFNYSVLMPTTDIPPAVDTFARDTVEAAAMLRQMGVQKVALVGGSVGGLSALRAGLDAGAPTGSSACRDQARPRSPTRLLGCRYQSCSWRPAMTS